MIFDRFLADVIYVVSCDMTPELLSAFEFSRFSLATYMRNWSIKSNLAPTMVLFMISPSMSCFGVMGAGQLIVFLDGLFIHFLPDCIVRNFSGPRTKSSSKELGTTCP